MKNKILKKNFFIRKDNAIYCGKCGKKQLQDNYNLKRHASICGFTTDVEPKIFDDGKDYAYSFKISKSGKELFFYVFSYNLTLRPGFKDRYCGSEWKQEFRAVFRKNSKIVREEGMYNVDTWMKMMVDQKNIPSLSSDSDTELVSSFFSDILAIESLGAFLDIYRNKGYSSVELDESVVCKLLGMENLHDKMDIGVNEIKNLSVSVNAEIKEINEKCCLLLSLHFSTSCFEDKFQDVKILLTDGYAKSNANCQPIIKTLLSIKPYRIRCKVSKETLMEFADKNPSFMIKQYIENGGKNIFIPLLASNYDKCLELLYKAGIPTLAEVFFDIKKNNHLVTYKNNLKEIFGLPVKTIKKIASTDFAMMDGLFSRLAEVYAYSPRLLSLESYGLSALQFLMYQNITRKKDFKLSQHSVAYLNSLDENGMFRTLKYLNKIEHNNVDKKGIWDLYKDYVDMSLRYGEFVYGLYPDNLQNAHDYTAELLWKKQNKEKDEIFKRVVSDEYYQSFITDDEEFKEDKYKIITPKSPYDLVVESAQMNNCVKTYIDKVCNGSTMIFFLRDKKSPKKSLCTIELLPSKNLNQVKAYGNSKANDDIRDFVKKWARIKSVNITTTYDMK